jgi:hypothetical protein
MTIRSWIVIMAAMLAETMPRHAKLHISKPNGLSEVFLISATALRLSL